MTVIGTITKTRLGGSIMQKEVAGSIVHNRVVGSIAGSSGISWSAYWTPQTALGGETPSMWVKSRSGAELVDSLGGTNPSIQLPYLYKPIGNEYAYVADNGALNAGVSSDFTMAGWFKAETVSSANYYLCGKNVAASISGRYGFLALTTSNYLSAAVQSSGGYKSVDSTVNFLTAGWVFLLMDINITAKTLRFFINNVQVGTDVSWTGTIGALSNAYEFVVGAGHASGGGGFGTIAKSSHSDVWVFHRLLSPGEQTTLYNRGVISGAAAHYTCVLNSDNVLYDFSGNGLHLTGVNLLKSTKVKYGAGSRQGLDKGYTRYVDFPNKDIFINHKDDGTSLGIAAPTGYTEDADYAGDTANYNMADSYVAIPGLDRSNTTNNTYLARQTLAQHYYDSANVSWVHANEFSNLTLSNYFNNDYRGLMFTKITSRVLNDLYSYATNKTGTNYEKAIKYSGETGILKYDIIVSPHICAVNGAKVLKFDDVNTLSLSNNSGATYPITLVTTLNHVDYAFIFDNGNIMFCDHTKVYYSDDNLATYQESTVLGIDGNPYVAGTLNNFRAWGVDSDEVTHNGVKLHTWGAYVTSGTAETNNINQWETIDGGVTVKSVYKFGVSNPAASCRHIHSINYDSSADVFYMTTGDGTGKDNLMQGTRNAGTGAWTWIILGTGNASTIWQMVGSAFDSDYLYFVNEGENTAYKGIMRSLKSDIANIATNQERVFISDTLAVNLIKIGSYFIMCEGAAGNKVTVSADGVHFSTRVRDELTMMAEWGSYQVRGKLDNGYYVLACIEDGETLTDFAKGSTLLIKISEIIVT